MFSPASDHQEFINFKIVVKDGCKFTMLLSMNVYNIPWVIVKTPYQEFILLGYFDGTLFWVRLENC